MGDWRIERRFSYAQQYNYILNVGRLVRASASEEQSMRCPSFKRGKGGWRIQRRSSYAQPYNYILNVGTYLGASASGGAPHRGRSPACQSLIYFWGAYLQCIWLCASKMLVNPFGAERLVVFGVPSLFSLRSPKLGLWIIQPLRG